jgi:primosomal protein N' (replication factor Y)
VEQIKLGKRVSVQFGKSKVYAAIIAKVHNTPPKDYEAKYLLSVLDDAPIVYPHQLALWEWMAQYYMCTEGEVMQAAVPSHLKITSESVFIYNELEQIDNIQLSDAE